MRNFANRVEDVSGGGERSEFLPLGSACEKFELRPDEEVDEAEPIVSQPWLIVEKLGQFANHIPREQVPFRRPLNEDGRCTGNEQELGEPAGGVAPGHQRVDLDE